MENGQREIAVLRSDNGIDWVEHSNITNERKPKNVDELFKGYKKTKKIVAANLMYYVIINEKIY